MRDPGIHMTTEEIQQVWEANLDGMEACSVAMLVKKDGRWQLMLGETHSDGVFRHVAYLIDGDYPEIMRRHLYESSPEGKKAWDDKIEALKAEMGHAD